LLRDSFARRTAGAALGFSETVEAVRVAGEALADLRVLVAACPALGHAPAVLQRVGRSAARASGCRAAAGQTVQVAGQAADSR